MADWPAHILLTLDTERPIEINNFVSAFTSLSNQYQKFARAHPNSPRAGAPPRGFVEHAVSSIIGQAYNADGWLVSS
jgi:hypothetical protein